MKKGKKSSKNPKIHEPHTELAYHGQNWWKKKKEVFRMRAHCSPPTQTKTLAMAKIIKSPKTAPWDTPPQFPHSRGHKTKTWTHLALLPRFQQVKMLVAEPTLDEVATATKTEIMEHVEDLTTK